MILITRPLAQSENLKSLISKLGLESVLFPAFKINKIKVKKPNQQYDLIIFISTNAVDYAEKYFNSLLTGSIKIFAIGPITAKKLFDKDIKVDGYAQSNSSSKKLLNMPYFKALTNKKILIVRGRGGSENLKNILQEKNQIDYLEVYERVPCNLTPLHSQSLKTFLAAKNGVVIINSVESLSSVISLVRKESEAFLEQLKDRELIVLSERIKSEAEVNGFKKIKVTLNPSDQDIVNILSE